MTTDLWSVDQTQVSFMGITAHWIESNPTNGDWLLMSTVIAFRAISGTHDGANLGRYFVGLCERAGIIDNHDSKVPTVPQRAGPWIWKPSANLTSIATVVLSLHNQQLTILVVGLQNCVGILLTYQRMWRNIVI